MNGHSEFQSEALQIADKSHENVRQEASESPISSEIG